MKQNEPKFMKILSYVGLDAVYQWIKFHKNWSTQRGGEGIQSFQP